MQILNCELVYYKSLLSVMYFCYKRKLYYICHSKHWNVCLLKYGGNCCCLKWKDDINMSLRRQCVFCFTVIATVHSILILQRCWPNDSITVTVTHDDNLGDFSNKLENNCSRYCMELWIAYITCYWQYRAVFYKLLRNTCKIPYVIFPQSYNCPKQRGHPNVQWIHTRKWKTAATVPGESSGVIVLI